MVGVAVVEAPAISVLRGSLSNGIETIIGVERKPSVTDYTARGVTAAALDDVRTMRRYNVDPGVATKRLSSDDGSSGRGCGPASVLQRLLRGRALQAYLTALENLEEEIGGIECRTQRRPLHDRGML